MKQEEKARNKLEESLGTLERGSLHSEEDFCVTG
jgi:hypothetical protein